MVALMIIQGVLQAVQGALSIAQAFTKERQQIVGASGEGKGFWSFYSYSNIDHFTAVYEMAPQYITNELVPNILKHASPDFAKHKDELIDELKDIADYGELSIPGNNLALTTATYHDGTGKMNFFVCSIVPDRSIIGDELGVRFETLRCEISMTLAQNWMLVCNIESQFTSTKSSWEIQYLPTGLDTDKVVDAIAIAMAPAVLGLIEMPEGFMKAMQKTIENHDKTELDLVDPEMLKKAWDATIKRQKQRDEQFQKGVEQLGQGVSSIVTGLPKNE